MYTPRWLTRPRMVWAGSAAGLLTLMVLVGVLLHGRSSDDAAGPEASGRAMPTPSKAPPPAETTPSAPEPSAVTLDQLPQMPSPSASSAQVPQPSPAAHPAVHPGPPTPAAKPGPAPASPAAGKANCTPPFTLDPATGKKKWKPECL